ncbi:MAG TPA: ferritin [Thermoanaerobaculia bacterium]|nr:ferritin [Thermoanaerobaculia bacterium]
MPSSDKIIAAFNEQIGRELGASHLYVSIATHFDGEALPRLSGFFYRQGEEEREHAMRFVKFIMDVDGRVRIPAVSAPQHDFAGAEEAVAKALDSERAVSKAIFDLTRLADEEGDYFARRFLDWFIDEQREEEATMSALLQVVQRAKGSTGLLQVEEYLSHRGSGPLESAAGPGGPEGA